MDNSHILLLGTIKVQLGNKLISHFESFKACALLAYLAAEAGRPQSRSTLAGLLWPDYPERSASQSLRQALYSLRKALNDPIWLESDRQMITLVPGEGCRIDTQELEKAIAAVRGGQGDTSPQQAAAVSRLRTAVAAYRGPFQDGFTLDDSPEFEAWIVNRREHHTRQVLEALSLLAGWYESQGEWEQAERPTRLRIESMVSSACGWMILSMVQYTPISQ